MKTITNGCGCEKPKGGNTTSRPVIPPTRPKSK